MRSTMTTTTTTTILIALALGMGGAGCAENHERTPIAASNALASCLADGRGLREIAVVDNNDTEDHGALLRFELSDDGVLAAAGEDGTLKLWTLDAEWLATFDGTILTYGPEIPAAPIADLAFDGGDVLAGDIRGIVLRMSPDGSMFPVGGTTPEIAIRAVAFDPATRRLAHAQAGDVPPLVVRAEDGTTNELSSELLISDLLFLPSGELLVAGERDGVATVERLGADLARVGELRTWPVAGGLEEIASLDGATIAGVGAGHVVLGDEAFALEGGRSIALASAGGSTVALVAGAGGLDAIDASGTPGASLWHLGGDAVTVRVDATGTLAIVGESDAHLRVLACAD